eukprot:CAMPEP_0201575426 /NCGR_PEP_ID=MMETSP0190_2-20130828/20631_1 /ASSEMBLY_ACC=CAM_ASM_000263 /TAXON_ID=37353 /ORGANISM="Rosalina sp." /LENGTH=429 /DNA_ID=CAMNT_0048005055 /DNA_START=1542 /DNA_END=2831 /DNA_ORIENTATION=+
MIPAIISWFVDFLGDDGSGEGQWGDANDDEDDDDKKKQLKRHQTMGNATAGNRPRKDSNYKKSPEYKLRKKREKEQRKKKQMIRRAEKYRMLRQMQQVDTQLNAIPTSDSHTTVTALKKSLKTIIKNYNPRKVKHILTPNINDIVDEVTSDKTPIAKLQGQVKDLRKVMDELFGLVKASQTFTVATTMAMQQSVDPDGDQLLGGGDGLYAPSSLAAVNQHKSKKKGQGGLVLENRDSTMAFVSAAAEQLQSALTGRSSNVHAMQGGLPSTQISNRQSTNRMSVKDIATTLFAPVDDNPYGVQTNKNSLVYKPTDVMRHKQSYKRKSANNLLQFGGMDDEDDDDDVKKDEEDRPMVSNITVDQYNFDQDDEIELNDIENSSGVEEEEEVNNANGAKKKERPKMINDDTEKYLDSLLDEETQTDHTDNEKP